MIKFIAGLFVGAFIGCTVLALAKAGGREE
jgi:hypothetical protein